LELQLILKSSQGATESNGELMKYFECKYFEYPFARRPTGVQVFISNVHRMLPI